MSFDWTGGVECLVAADLCQGIHTNETHEILSWQWLLGEGEKRMLQL